ncbi:carboxylating nicotinate-nucleotide diphosphorylase [Desulfurivibrio sp. D14AmB]|uniref:carboxylating nicotinate-nucleotide diphosphorylase n=1 Tax=Desulfurivibrio sp. D14AmB TaxID=3374370 RepID=UPI00376EA5AD
MFKNNGLERGLREAIASFLDEDLGRGDITGEAIFPATQQGSAVFIAKETMVTAGIEQIAPLVFTCRNPEIAAQPLVADGTRVDNGDLLLRLTGPTRDLLAAERVALNLCQRLCGIATLTARFVEQVQDLPVVILDTRKTTPGLRTLERAAVRAGGGHNHRFNLNDGILIKDNHIAAAGSILRAVAKVRAGNPNRLPVEVECETLAQVEEALAAQVEIIMLDNMAPAMMAQAVQRVRGRALLEASGGVNLENVRRIAETGVDRISIGALTHSAPARDISMEMV